MLGEVERKMYRDLSATDWRRSTVFKGLSLHARKDRIAMETGLKDFGVSAEEIASCTTQSALDVLWRDQMAKTYVTMDEVSNF